MDVCDIRFTMQQLRGGTKYRGPCRIGNWQEDVELEAQRLREFELKKSRGELLISQKASQSRLLNQRVVLSYPRDGVIRYNDVVLIANQLGTLSANPFECGRKYDDITTTVIKTDQPFSRNAVVINKISTERYQDDILRYGDIFTIRTYDSLRYDFANSVVKPAYYLWSSNKSSDGLAKRSREQEVSWTLEYSTNCMFKIVPKDIMRRAIDEGCPVPSSSPIAFYHVKSNQALACVPEYDLLTDFGQEYEVYCKSITSNGRVYPNIKEQTGLRISSQASKSELEGNMWYILMNESSDEIESKYEKLTTSIIIKKIRTALIAKGDRGGIGLLRALEVTENKHGALYPEDIKFALKDVNLLLDKQEIEIFMGGFKQNEDGSIDYISISDAIIPLLHESRARQVAEIFTTLQPKNGLISIPILVKKYNIEVHPGLKAGRVSIDQAHHEFISHWQFTINPGYADVNEFVEFHKVINAIYPNEEDFNLFISSAWKI